MLTNLCLTRPNTRPFNMYCLTYVRCSVVTFKCKETVRLEHCAWEGRYPTCCWTTSDLSRQQRPFCVFCLESKRTPFNLRLFRDVYHCIHHIYIPCILMMSWICFYAVYSELNYYMCNQSLYSFSRRPSSNSAREIKFFITKRGCFIVLSCFFVY